MTDSGDDEIDLRRLADDAAKSVYDPRALPCRLPWSHRWTLWRPTSQFSMFQQRTCVRCGLTKVKYTL